MLNMINIVSCKGGALVKYGGKSRLLELSQVPADKVCRVLISLKYI